MIVGLILGLIIGATIAFVVYNIAYNIIYSGYKWKSLVVGIASFIIILVGGCLIGVSVDNVSAKQFIEKYPVTQQLYYNSIDDEKLSGLERLQIVQMAKRSNDELASWKIEIDAWWNIFLKNDFKQQIRELNYIK